MDYASATPGDAPNSWDQFWYGNVWGVPAGVIYRGIIVRSGGTGNNVSKFANVTDGTAYTIMIGEKWLNKQRYDTGDWHDDRGWTDGWDPDIVRYTAAPLLNDNFGNPSWDGYQFGSAHTAIVHFLMGDGAVRAMNVSIDRTLYNHLGDRQDGNNVSAAFQ